MIREIQNLLAAGDITGLIANLHSSDEVTRSLAREALLAIGPPAVPALIASLKSPDRNLHGHLYPILSHIGQPALDPLIGLLHDEDEDIQCRAAFAIGALFTHAHEHTIPLESEPAVAALVACITDDRSGLFIRDHAAKAFQKIGKPALEPLLAVLLRHTGPARYFAMLALLAIPDPRAVEPLLQILSCGDPFDQRMAIRALGYINDPRAIRPLQDLYLNSDDSDTLLVIRDALHALGISF